MRSTDPLNLAKKHLDRVQSSWDPPDWLDLSAYSLYAIEAAIDAAAQTASIPLKRTHWDKADVAVLLAREHGLPDVSGMMRDLNEVRKSEAYGDIATPPKLDAEEVASDVEAYIDAVTEFVAA